MTNCKIAKRNLIYFIIKVLDFLPAPFKLLPYDFCFFVTKTFLQQNGAKVWAKNSYKFRNITFGLSDIDVVVLSPTEKTSAKLWTKVRTLKKFLPPLGEFSLISKEKIATYAPFINSYELYRDPLLHLHLNSLNIQIFPSEAQKFVFISRMLLNDKKNLLNWPDLRVKKWEKHLADIGENFNDNSKKVVSVVCQNILNPIVAQDVSPLISEIMTQNFNTSERLQGFHREISQHNQIPLYACIAPTLWLGSSISLSRLDEDFEIISHAEEKFQEILHEQIRWEIWGLYTQIYLLKNDKDNIHRHLSYLEQTLSALTKIESKKGETTQAISHLTHELSSS